MEAMQANSIDVIKRMREITLVMQTPVHVLESQGVTPGDVEGVGDELYLLEFNMKLIIYCFCAKFEFSIILQKCWMSYKSMWSLLTWLMVRFTLTFLLWHTLITVYLAVEACDFW